MQRKLAALAALPISAALLSSCAEAVSDAYVVENDPGSVEHVEGSDIGRVSLADGAAERLQVQTTPVERQGRELAVPASAVFVDPDGVWWVYTNPEPGVYVRHEIAVDHHRDGRAVLSSGPKAGTEVVTVGVAELYGIEAEVGH
jgi:hypothetical protein